MSERENVYVCPQCQSDNIQKYEVAFANGTSVTTSTTVGAGFSGQMGIGAAKTQSVGVSNMAASVAPPAKKKYGGKIALVVFLSWVVAAVVGGLVNSTTLANILMVVCLIGFGYIFLYQKTYLWNRDVHPQLMNEWHHSYVCLKCGNRFMI